MEAIEHQNNGFEQVERWLTEAGISYNVVEACPHPQCEVCTSTSLSAAA